MRPLSSSLWTLSSLVVQDFDYDPANSDGLIVLRPRYTAGFQIIADANEFGQGGAPFVAEVILMPLNLLCPTPAVAKPKRELVNLGVCPHNEGCFQLGFLVSRECIGRDCGCTRFIRGQGGFNQKYYVWVLFERARREAEHTRNSSVGEVAEWSKAPLC
jgi:hypothetical protein